MKLLHLSHYRHDLVRMIFCMDLPNCKKALDVILDNIKKSERLDVSYWRDEVWYIEIVDEPMFRRATTSDDRLRSRRFCISIDIQNDEILWNKNGGNCVVRGVRWPRIMRFNFSKQWDDNAQDLKHQRHSPTLDHKHIHIYK